jgi:hypothetical protein
VSKAPANPSDAGLQPVHARSAASAANAQRTSEHLIQHLRVIAWHVLPQQRLQTRTAQYTSVGNISFSARTHRLIPVLPQRHRRGKISAPAAHTPGTGARRAANAHRAQLP